MAVANSFASSSVTGPRVHPLRPASSAGELVPVCALEAGGGCTIKKPSSANFSPESRYDTVKSDYDTVSECAAAGPI